MQQQLVSVCVPAYNCEKYIRQTLECLCAQTYQNIEVILVNDGSTDGTLAIAKQVDNKRLKIIDAANHGASSARNTAFKAANGSHIIFFDADDLIGIDFIAQQMNKIGTATDVVVLSAWGRFYNDDTSTFAPEQLPGQEMFFDEWIKLYWYQCNPMTNPGRALIPAGLIKQAGLWAEGLSLNDDLEFFTKIFLNARKVIFNSDAVFYYRSGIQGLSSAKGQKAFLSLYNSLSLSIGYVLSKYKNDALLLKSCANMWQLFVYEVYPQYPELVSKAEENISSLGGSALKYPSGKATGALANLLGWKKAKRIRALF